MHGQMAGDDRFHSEKRDFTKCLLTNEGEEGIWDRCGILPQTQITLKTAHLYWDSATALPPDSVMITTHTFSA